MNILAAIFGSDKQRAAYLRAEKLIDDLRETRRQRDEALGDAAELTTRVAELERERDDREPSGGPLFSKLWRAHYVAHAAIDEAGITRVDGETLAERVRRLVAERDEAQHVAGNRGCTSNALGRCILGTDALMPIRSALGLPPDANLDDMTERARSRAAERDGMGVFIEEAHAAIAWIDHALHEAGGERQDDEDICDYCARVLRDLARQVTEAGKREIAAVQARDSVLARLETWTHQYGAALCPNGRADTFGEGMREAKSQVARILSGSSDSQPQAEPSADEERDWNVVVQATERLRRFDAKTIRRAVNAVETWTSGDSVVDGGLLALVDVGCRAYYAANAPEGADDGRDPHVCPKCDGRFNVAVGCCSDCGYPDACADEDEAHSTHRGHATHEASPGKWVYTDTGEPVPDNPERACGHCGKANTTEGHDGCLGTLPGGVMNACCGHGRASEAYVQFHDGRHYKGDVARGYQLVHASADEDAARDAVADDEVVPRAKDCECDYEMGDSDCPVHPACPHCGELIEEAAIIYQRDEFRAELDQLRGELKRRDATILEMHNGAEALDVERAEEESRVAKLDDDCRKLRAELAEAKAEAERLRGNVKLWKQRMVDLRGQAFRFQDRAEADEAQLVEIRDWYRNAFGREWSAELAATRQGATVAAASEADAAVLRSVLERLRSFYTADELAGGHPNWSRAVREEVALARATITTATYPAAAISKCAWWSRLSGHERGIRERARRLLVSDGLGAVCEVLDAAEAIGCAAKEQS